MTIELYNDDCLKLMRKFDDRKFNAVITDPPYEEETHRAKDRQKKRIRNDGYGEIAKLGFESINATRAKSAKLMLDLCGGWFLAFCTPEGVMPWRNVIATSKHIKYKRACVWVKPDAAPQFNGQGPSMGAEMMVTAWCGKGHSKWNGGGRAGVFTHCTKNKDRHGVHPAEKPLNLMMELIGLFTNVGDTVLDPYMGSGTTGIACVRLGRNFVGIERDKKYFEIATKRIESAASQKDFFHETPQLEILGRPCGDLVGPHKGERK